MIGPIVPPGKFQALKLTPGENNDQIYTRIMRRIQLDIFIVKRCIGKRTTLIMEKTIV